MSEINLNYECAFCKTNLFKERQFVKHIVLDGKPEVICNSCNQLYTPSVLSKVIVTTKFFDKENQLLKFKMQDFSLNLFLTNNFSEQDIENYLNKSDNQKLYNFLTKLINPISNNGTYDFGLMICVARKKKPVCEICDKPLDFEECIYFKTGKHRPTQMCKECDSKC